jgi:hypothetical protein
MNGLNKREYLVNLICINAQHSRAWYILTKGQLISKADMNQQPTEVFLYFCPSFRNESIKKDIWLMIIQFL